MMKKTKSTRISDKPTMASAKASKTCWLIFEFVMVMLDEIRTFKNLTLRNTLIKPRFINVLFWLHFGALFPFSPHLQIFTCKFVDYIFRLLWKFTYRIIRPQQTYLVFILNLVKSLVTLIHWRSCEVGGKGKRAHFGYHKNTNLKVKSMGLLTLIVTILLLF